MRMFFNLLSPVFGCVPHGSSKNKTSSPVPAAAPAQEQEPCQGSEASLGGAHGEAADAVVLPPLRPLLSSPLGSSVHCVEKDVSDKDEDEDDEDEDDVMEVGNAEPEAVPETPNAGETPSKDVEEEEEGSEGTEGEVPVYEEVCDPFVFIRRVHELVARTPAERLGDVFAFPASLPVLPPKAAGAPRATLVLDLDETLVHCSMQPIASPNLVFPVEWEGARYVLYANTRPGLAEFLRTVGALFEVVLFTASMPVYAGRLCDLLDPAHALIHHRLYRHACVLVDSNYLKDLRVLGRDLATTVIVDNSPQAFAFQYDNGIPILSYFDSQTDRELPKLLPLLRRLAQADDVRPILRNHYKLYRRIESPFLHP